MILTPPRSALRPVKASIALLALLVLTLLLAPAQALGQSLEEISVDGEAPAPEPETIEERLKRAAAAREAKLQEPQQRAQ